MHSIMQSDSLGPFLFFREIGVWVVIFLILLETIVSGAELGIARVFRLFVQEAIGGGLLGLGVGLLAYRLLKQVDNYQVEILITLGLVTGGYVLRMHCIFLLPLP